MLLKNWQGENMCVCVCSGGKHSYKENFIVWRRKSEAAALRLEKQNQACQEIMNKGSKGEKKAKLLHKEDYI